MTARTLPSHEWFRLDEAPTERVPWQALDLVYNRVVIVEDDAEQIVGRCVLMRAVHGEFAWIADAHRGKVAVARKLRDAVLQESRDWGAPTLLMAACSDTMRSIVPRLGAQLLPGSHYVLNLKGAR